MKTEIFTERIRYTSDTGDWLIEVVNRRREIRIRIIPNAGDFEVSSGTNLDNLITLLQEVKADVQARGMNWSGN